MLLLFLVLWCKDNHACSSYQLDTIYIVKDSVISKNVGVQYKYKVIRKNKTGEDVLYNFETQSVSYVEENFYKKKQLNYVAFTFYDEPTGRIYLILYNFSSKELYKTEWFDDNATGDKLIEEKVYFKKGIVTVKESETLKHYNVKLLLLNKKNDYR